MLTVDYEANTNQFNTNQCDEGIKMHHQPCGTDETTGKTQVLHIYASVSTCTLPLLKSSLIYWPTHPHRAPKGFLGCPHRITLFGSM
jgi:hypothetical protein